MHSLQKFLIFFYTFSIPLAAFSGKPFVEIKFEGTFPRDIHTYFNEMSRLKQFEQKEIPSQRFIQKLIKEDKATLLKVLHSMGYYDASIGAYLEAGDIPKIITFKIKPNQQYKYAHVSVNLTSREAPSGEIKELLDTYVSKLERNPPQGEFIFDEFQKLQNELANVGHPFSKILSHEATLNVAEKTIDLTLRIDLGSKTYFGELMIQGEGNIPSSYVRNRCPFKEGEVFNAKKLISYQQKLSDSGLFDQSIARMDEEKLSDNDVPISVLLTPRKEKTIYGGVTYSTSEGAGIQGGWTHRNITGIADRFKAQAEYAQKETGVKLNYALPDFWRVNTSFLVGVAATRVRTKAYDMDQLSSDLSFNTVRKEGENYFYGVSWSRPIVTSDTSKRRYHIIGVPLGFQKNESDDVLDPQKGYKLALFLTPEVTNQKSHNFMVRAVLDYDFYIPLFSEDVLAFWSRLGRVFALEDRFIPKEKRFYAGGSGSVRAYGYQKAGPIDEQGRPVGVKTMIEGGVEYRKRFSESWGGVTFFEMARASSELAPAFKKVYFYGIGCGLRYYTSIGPIRADIAFPLNENKPYSGHKLKDKFQFYVSFGQSF